jgi:DNA-binding XRE family transcriptional regulator
MMVSYYNNQSMTYKAPAYSAARHKPAPPLPVARAVREIADDVVVWRKLRGLTQAQLADRAGVSLNTLRKLEGADAGIKLENVLLILRALGVLDSVSRALDPYESDVGRLRSDEQLPQRVRPKSLTGSDG